jgi:signal transduction histidine kinase
LWPQSRFARIGALFKRVIPRDCAKCAANSGTALASGLLLSRGALGRIAEVHGTSRQIMAGQLSKRLKVRGTNDDFDKLARIVNEMLDEIERLMLQAKGAGEDIAHDPRTPLTRLRGRLERALLVGPGNPDVTTTLGTAIEDIDQILGTISAILRIGEVEHGQRRAGFREVDLADVRTAVGRPRGRDWD